MKPKILLVSDEGYKANIPHYIVNCAYGTAIGKAGGLPLAMLDDRHPQDYAALGDGLLLTGGKDIHCGRYGEIYHNAQEIPPLTRERETLEFNLCRLFLAAGKPIFGIGRGMQVLNVVLGGTLHRELREVTAQPHICIDERGISCFVTHNICVTQGSKLSGVLHSSCVVNSAHHQGIKLLGEGLVAAAHTQDNLIEAVEHTSLPAFGVQWHPEQAIQDTHAGQALFNYFVSLCKENVK